MLAVLPVALDDMAVRLDRSNGSEVAAGIAFELVVPSEEDDDDDAGAAAAANAGMLSDERSASMSSAVLSGKEAGIASLAGAADGTEGRGGGAAAAAPDVGNWNGRSGLVDMMASSVDVESPVKSRTAGCDSRGGGAVDVAGNVDKVETGREKGMLVAVSSAEGSCCARWGIGGAAVVEVAESPAGPTWGRGGTPVALRTSRSRTAIARSCVVYLVSPTCRRLSEPAYDSEVDLGADGVKLGDRVGELPRRGLCCGRGVVGRPEGL